SRLPVGDAVAAGELGALAGILEELDLGAVGVGDPALPGLVDAELLGPVGHAERVEMGEGGVEVDHLEADMVDPVGFGELGFGLEENLDIGAAAGIEIIAESLAVLAEVEGDVEAEHLAVPFGRRLEIARESAHMRNLAHPSAHAEILLFIGAAGGGGATSLADAELRASRFVLSTPTSSARRQLCRAW